jgi:superfamily I DNA/RNA helicase
MHESIEKEWKTAVEKIVKSDHPKKIIVAGPGAGKTSLFKQLLAKSREKNGNTEDHLTVTFINDLANELKRDLEDLSNVATFHAYCKQLLHKSPYLREGLLEDFQMFPKLPTLIKSDWSLLNPGMPAPEFIKLIRAAVDNKETQFFIDRSNHYNSVAFDDMIFRVFTKWTASPKTVQKHALILVDEYQDFNLLEVSLLQLLSEKNPVAIAGDDDQVLYGSFRGSSWNFIRDLYASPDYESGDLPFCLRCPEVIVSAFDDIVRNATDNGHLKGRIPKRYEYFPPYKEADSKAHPQIRTVQTSIQKKGSGNYFGRVLEKVIRSIPLEYIKESHEKSFPTVLIIGNKQYLTQISAYLKEAGYALDEKSGGGDDEKIVREDGLKILKENPESTLGWRIMLEVDKPSFFRKDTRKFLQFHPLRKLIPEEYITRIMSKVAALKDEPIKVESDKKVPHGPTIKLTSFQGAKGLSAQYVFVVGTHDGDIPKRPDDIKDVEICMLLVALTRTRKQCYLVYTKGFAGVLKKPSIFLDWIDKSRKKAFYVDAAYFKRETLRTKAKT